MRARNALFLIFFLLCACSTGSGGGDITIGDLMPIKMIDTPEEAQKALIIFQDFRIGTMRVVQKSVKLNVRPVTDFERFEKTDSLIRPSWDSANRAVREWKLTGNKSDAFFTLYNDLLNLALTLDSYRRESNAGLQR